MDMVEYIKDLSEKEIEEFFKERIEFLEEKNDNQEKYTIGYNLDYNPSAFNLLDFEENIPKVELISGFNGYIPLGTKIIYGMVYNADAKVTSNYGHYYYIDDNSYILEFIKSIKDKDINNIYELFDLIFEFIYDYFGYIETISREDMMKLIFKNETAFYKPVEEHKYSMFKEKGNAQCSEIGIMAQNILSFLGIYSKLIIGAHKMDLDDVEGHAYNMVQYEEDEELKSIILDFSSSVFVINSKHKVIGYAPFIHYLDISIDDAYKNILSGESITAQNYAYIIDKGMYWVMNQDSYREYSITPKVKNKKIN